jgi:hypothetical protein
MNTSICDMGSKVAPILCDEICVTEKLNIGFQNLSYFVNNSIFRKGLY